MEIGIFIDSSASTTGANKNAHAHYFDTAKSIVQSHLKAHTEQLTAAKFSDCVEVIKDLTEFCNQEGKWIGSSGTSPVPLADYIIQKPSFDKLILITDDSKIGKNPYSLAISVLNSHSNSKNLWKSVEAHIIRSSLNQKYDPLQSPIAPFLHSSPFQLYIHDSNSNNVEVAQCKISGSECIRLLDTIETSEELTKNFSDLATRVWIDPEYYAAHIDPLIRVGFDLTDIEKLKQGDYAHIPMAQVPPMRKTITFNKKSFTLSKRLYDDPNLPIVVCPKTMRPSLMKNKPNADLVRSGKMISAHKGSLIFFEKYGYFPFSSIEDEAEMERFLTILQDLSNKDGILPWNVIEIIIQVCKEMKEALHSRHIDQQTYESIMEDINQGYCSKERLVIERKWYSSKAEL